MTNTPTPFRSSYGRPPLKADAIIEVLRLSPNGLTADHVAAKLGLQTKAVRMKLSRMALYGQLRRVKVARTKANPHPNSIWTIP